MPVHHTNKCSVESVVARQVEEWASRLQNRYDEKLQVMQQEQRETLAIVNRMGKYVNNLEMKINFMKSDLKNIRTNKENIDLLEEPVDSFVGNVNNVRSDDLAKRVSMLENFCGYDPEREAYAALDLGTGDLLLPEHKLSNRLEKLEKSISKISRNVRELETEVEELTPRAVNSSENHLTSNIYFPEKQRPKSSHGDHRHVANNKDPLNYGHFNNRNHPRDNAFVTPQPPVSVGGYRHAPPSKARNVSRTGSAAPSSSSRPPMQKIIQDIRCQIDEVDEKNNIHNTFLMNELSEKVNSQEEKTDRKLFGLDSKLKNYIANVEKDLRNSIGEVETNVRSKIDDFEKKIQHLQENNHGDTEERIDTKEFQKQDDNDQNILNSKQYDSILQERIGEVAEKQREEFQQKEIMWQRELQKKEDELKRILDRNESTLGAFSKLQEEAKALEAANSRMKEEHEKHIHDIEKEYEERRSIIDERTELYKAETMRLKKVHEDLQKQVNLEIKQRVSLLENEKNELQEKLSEEMSTHNLQAAKDRSIRDTLQKDVEMYKNSCTQAHKEKEQILSKLRLAEAKNLELEAKLTSNHQLNEHISPKLNSPRDLVSTSPKREPSTPLEHNEEESDSFSYNTPLPRTYLDTDKRRASFQRVDTPMPHELERASSSKNTLESSRPFIPKAHSQKLITAKQSSQIDNDPLNDDESNKKDLGIDNDDELQEMVQSKLSQDDIDDIVILEELIRDKERELLEASAAKSVAKKKIKAWISDFQKAYKRSPNQEEKEGVSEMYLEHQKLSDEKESIAEALQVMKAALHERVSKVVE